MQGLVRKSMVAEFQSGIQPPSQQRHPFRIELLVAIELTLVDKSHHRNLFDHGGQDLVDLCPNPGQSPVEADGKMSQGECDSFIVCSARTKSGETGSEDN